MHRRWILALATTLVAAPTLATTWVKNFKGANLAGYNFSKQDVKRYNFEGANLVGANFSSAQGDDADLGAS